MIRNDDYKVRRTHLQNLSNEELKDYFWTLAEKVVEPLVELAKNHTSPSIERSVLLRMGFSSLQAKTLVEKVINHNLISKGAGHVVYRHHKLTNLSIRDAGLKLINDEGWDEVLKSFGVKSNE
jgi:D-ornithine 4,5-aminomutase subunit alpha